MRIRAKLLALALALMLPGGAALAEGTDEPADVRPVTSCLQAAGLDQGAAESCIMAGVQACTEVPPGAVTGPSMVDMNDCLGVQLNWWQGQMAQAYDQAQDVFAAQDAEMADMDAAVPAVLPLLEAMQQSWERNAQDTCDFQMGLYGNGSGAGQAGLICRLQETGRQTLLLQQSLPK